MAKKVPISKEQYTLYQSVARDAQEAARNAQEANVRLQICVTSILAGHGITDAGVLAVTPKGIELAPPEKVKPATSNAGP